MLCYDHNVANYGRDIESKISPKHWNFFAEFYVLDTSGQPTDEMNVIESFRF